jgi:hypothetical protein
MAASGTIFSVSRGTELVSWVAIRESGVFKRLVGDGRGVPDSRI